MLAQEVATSRKSSRGIFSGAKMWFGGTRPVGGTAGGTSVVYGREAPELQGRRLADLYFLMRMYKPAYNFAYICKKDFQADEAWPYYASAVELAALHVHALLNRPRCLQKGIPHLSILGNVFSSAIKYFKA